MGEYDYKGFRGDGWIEGLWGLWLGGDKINSEELV